MTEYGEEMWTCVFLVCMMGVFGADADDVKSVSVMEGRSVTLHTDLTELQGDDLILWKFGPEETLIAQIIKRSSLFDSDVAERFRGRLKIDHQTGSLIITNIKMTDSGLYKLLINIDKDISHKRFNVTVYDHTPCCSLADPVTGLVMSAVVGVASLTVVLYEMS